MRKLNTAGDLRGFLTEVLIGIHDGTVDSAKAHAISKVSAQINQSLQVEVQAALQMEKLGGGKAVAGSMVIASHEMEVSPTPITIAHCADEPDPVRVANVRPVLADLPADKVWCDQCDMAVAISAAMSCRSKFCKAKEAA